MSLPDVLLGLLREPMCGTDLVAIFRTSIRHFWNADLSQIYRALESLERDGAVRSKSESSPKGPARRVYSLTAAGRRKLRRWIERAPRIPPVKLEYLAQLFSVSAADDPARHARALLTTLREEATGALQALEAIESALRDVPGWPHDMPSGVYYAWLTLRHGLHRRRALVAWIDESLASLKRRRVQQHAVTKDEVAQLMALLRSMSNTKQESAS